MLTIHSMIVKKALMLFIGLLTTTAIWADINLIADGSTVSTSTTWTNCTVNVTGSGMLTFTQRITISGNVTLNLGAGSTLIATKGIELSAGNTLTIDGSGSLTAQGEDGKSAIGSLHCGNLIVNDGNISATGGDGAAGIGGDQFTYEMGHVGNGKTTYGRNNQSVTGSVGSTPWDYEMWCNGGNNSLTFYDNGTFTSQWSATSGFYFTNGLRYSPLINHTTKHFALDYKYTKTGSASYGYIGVYGWTESPLTRFQIIDDWYTKPSIESSGTNFGTYAVDGATYTIYAIYRKQSPSLNGLQDFVEFYSIRETPRQQGHIDISAHFNKWDELFHGQTVTLASNSGDDVNTVISFGKINQVMFICEVESATGTIDCTYFDLTDNYNSGIITINGGSVTAAGGEGAMAIGASNNYDAQGTLALGNGVTIYGGDSKQIMDNVITGPTDNVVNRFRYMQTTPPEIKTLKGRFSVAADKQVTFSPGNLQYKASTSTWAFAENQYDFVGGDNTNISSTYDGWIDLFGWGTSGYNDKQPYMSSDNDYDYGDGANDLTGTNYDWGAYASISNGGNMDWRTLSASEWDYLLQTRDGAASKHGNATVAGIKGLVLLPDKWQLPEGLSFTADPTDWTTNTYTAEQWAEMEAVGAVFLPASGRRINGGTIYNFATNCRGYYWTVSASGEDRASFLDFREAQAAKNSTDYRSMGFAVRLASDVIIKTVSNPSITLSETTFVYDGKAKTPTVTVMDGATVIPASEYTVGYSNNVNAGTATVTITDNEDGDYIVSGSTTFSITAKTVSSPTVTLEKTYYFYDGTAKTPTVIVKDGETEIPASEYTVGYSNNTNVGTATVTITDKDGGNYTVSGSATFEIGLKGDANGDNKVDAADIVEMVNETKGQPSAKFKKNNADIDGNGQITDADITEVAKIILAK